MSSYPALDIQPINPVNAFIQGQQAAVDRQGMLTRNALLQTQLAQAQRANALYGNPNATPEDFIRNGDVAAGQALQQTAVSAQNAKQQAVAQLGSVAQRALTLDPASRKQFLQSAAQVYAPTFAALGANPQQGLAELEALPDAELENRLKQVAQFAPRDLMAVAPGTSVIDKNNPTAPPVVTGNEGVAFEDLGDRKVPVGKISGRVNPNVPELKKGVPPGQAYTDQSVEQTAQMIANNQIPMLTGFALKTPWGQQVVARVGQLNPNYQGAQYGAQASALRAFSSGKQSDTVRSLNVAISHLDTLSQLSTALNNKDTQLLNRVANIWKTQTGSPAPTNFTSARDIVANEVVKAVTASGGSLADRQEAQNQVNAASSPAQLAGVITTWKQLLSGQLSGLKQQYEQGTGRQDFERLVSPNARAQLESGSTSALPVGQSQNIGGFTVTRIK